MSIDEIKPNLASVQEGLKGAQATVANHDALSIMIALVITALTVVALIALFLVRKDR